MSAPQESRWAPIVVRGGLAWLHTDERLPRPHDPDDRPCAHPRPGGWELRVFAEGSRFWAFFARHGMLHAQWWHRERGLSVLSPSALTGDLWELAGVRGRRVRAPSFEALRALAQGSALPGRALVRADLRWALRPPVEAGQP